MRHYSSKSTLLQEAFPGRRAAPAQTALLRCLLTGRDQADACMRHPQSHLGRARPLSLSSTFSPSLGLQADRWEHCQKPTSHTRTRHRMAHMPGGDLTTCYADAQQSISFTLVMPCAFYLPAFPALARTRSTRATTVAMPLPPDIVRWKTSTTPSPPRFPAYHTYLMPQTGYRRCPISPTSALAHLSRHALPPPRRPSPPLPAPTSHAWYGCHTCVFCRAPPTRTRDTYTTTRFATPTRHSPLLLFNAPPPHTASTGAAV